MLWHQIVVNLFPLNSAGRSPRRQIDFVHDKLHRAVAHHHVHATRVTATGGGPEKTIFDRLTAARRIGVMGLAILKLLQ